MNRCNVETIIVAKLVKQTFLEHNHIMTTSKRQDFIDTGQIIQLHSQATDLLDQIIQANNGEVPYNCAANVILECYQRLNIPKGSVIEQGQFNGWTSQSGFSQRKNHIWLKVNSYTIIDPLAEQFRDNQVLVSPLSYEAKRQLTIKELKSLDSFCNDFEIET